MKDGNIFVDVDLTLVDANGRLLNGAKAALERLKAKGCHLFLLPAAGAEYARVFQTSRLPVSSDLARNSLYRGPGQWYGGPASAGGASARSSLLKVLLFIVLACVSPAKAVTPNPP